MASVVRRTYGQYCGLALGLDVIGERWTLLVVRELMAGPKRYSDLQDALQGIGTSLLANRLRQLEDAAVIFKRRLPKPSASVVYQLSDSGRELAKALLPLALWGARYQALEPRQVDDVYRAEWPLIFIAQMVSRQVAADTDYAYLFQIDESAAVMRVRYGEVSVSEVDPVDQSEADVVVHTDAVTMVDVSAGRLTINEAIADGRITLSGDSMAVSRLIDMLPARFSTPENHRVDGDLDTPSVPDGGR